MGKYSAGFSIIEVMLVLAITGLMMAVLLAGIGTSLNRERYRDAVESTQNYLQGQFNLAMNVNNSRPGDIVCSGGRVYEDRINADSGRGTSECTIAGRLITTKNSGEALQSTEVYSAVDATTLLVDEQTEMEVFQNANLITADAPHWDEYTPGWEISYKHPGGSESSVEFTALVVRSPLSGQIQTFVANQSNRSPQQVLADNTSGDFTLCLSNPNFSFGQERMGVKIVHRASNSSGVIPVAAGDGC